MKNFNTIDEILDFAIGEEQAAVDFYSELSESSKSEDMRQVFVDFAGEEIKHKQRLLENKGGRDFYPGNCKSYRPANQRLPGEC